jgi:hypothetical protein
MKLLKKAAQLNLLILIRVHVKGVDMNVDLDKLVYLDIDYVSRKYEELTGSNPKEQISKQEGGHATIKTFIAGAGISTHETRTYSVTSRDMLQRIWKGINEGYIVFNETSFANYSGTKIVWIEGMLTIASWNKEDDIDSIYKFIQIKNTESSKKTALLTNMEFFAAGFKEVLSASKALTLNVGVPVRCLLRIMWHVDASQMYTACPYVIVES